MLVQSVLPANIVPTELEGWGQVVLPFMATINTNRFSVFGYDNTMSMHLDEFDQQAIPAPGAIALLGVGALVVGRRRR